MRIPSALVSQVVAMAFLTVIANTGNSQLVFEDDFDNGNTDTPVKWTTRPLPFAEYDASSGDYIYRTLPGFDTNGPALSSDTADFVLEDTSAYSQIRAEGPFASMGIGARWNEAEVTGYYNGITAEGGVFIGRCDGNGDCRTIAWEPNSNLDVLSHDVMLRLDAIGSTLTTWAWRAGAPMPIEPMLTVEDDRYQSGTPGIYGTPLPGGQAIYRFVNAYAPGSPAEPQTSVLVPSTFAEVEGELSIANDTAANYHSQQVYSASEFAALPPGDNLLVRIDWRPDGQLVEAETYSAEQLLMKFSTTSKGPGALSELYARNSGRDEVVVYDGPASITTNNGGPIGGPKEIDYGIEFQEPFRYDPSKGNLLWDLTIVDGSQPLSLDWTLGAAGLTSTISSGGLPVDSPTAGYVQNAGGHIAKFTFLTLDCSGDGIIDVNDVNCAPAAYLNLFLAGVGLIQGDADGDNQVQFSDLVIMSNKFGIAGTYTEGDFDKNGTVQFGDLVILSDNFGQVRVGAAQGVPEPSGLALIGMGGLLLRLVRRPKTVDSRCSANQTF